MHSTSKRTLMNIKQILKNVDPVFKILAVAISALAIVGRLIYFTMSTTYSIKDSYKNELRRVDEEKANLSQTKCLDPSKEYEKAMGVVITNYPNAGFTKNEVFSMLSRGVTDDNKEVISAIKKVKQLEDIYIASCADAKSESDVLVPVSESEYIKAQWKKIFGFSS